MGHTILRLPAVKDKTGLARSTIYLRVAEGTFPRPVNLGGRAVGWVEDEIQSWLSEKIAASRKTAPSWIAAPEHIDKFRNAIVNAGSAPPDNIEPGGKLHRFASNGKRGNDSGWYVFHDDSIPAGAFGDWRTGLSESWRADIDRRLSPEKETAHPARRPPRRIVEDPSFQEQLGNLEVSYSRLEEVMEKISLSLAREPGKIGQHIPQSNLWFLVTHSGKHLRGISIVYTYDEETVNLLAIAICRDDWEEEE